MNISLPDQMKEWVEKQVATGRYADASDYVRDLVRGIRKTRPPSGGRSQRFRH